MIPALRVQSAVHQQVRVVCGKGFALFLGFACHDRSAQHQIGHHHRLLCIVEGQHIGGVVLFAVTLVEFAAFVFTDDTHRDLRIQGQCVADATRHKMAGQCGAVAGGLGNVAKLQGHLQLFESHGHSS